MTNVSTDDGINNFLSDVQSMSPDQFDQVLAIRRIFLDANSAFVESVKYGGLVFSLSDMLLGGIYIYRKHISIEFSNGAGFMDSESILDGGGKKRRHLKIRMAEDIIQKNTEYFVG